MSPEGASVRACVSRLGWHADIDFGWPFDSQKFRTEPSAGTRVIRIRDLDRTDNAIYSDEEAPDRYRVKSGELLVGMDGEFAVRWWRGESAWMNQRVARVRSRHGADIRFLAYAMAQPLSDLNAITYATTVKHLSAAGLKTLPIPVVSSRQQRQIADFLDRESERIDCARDAVLRLRDVAYDRQVDAAASVLGALPRRRLGWSIQAIDQGWSPQCDEVPAREGEWGVLKAGCVNHGYFDPAQSKRLPGDLAPREEALVRPGDLLVSRANTPDLVGSAAVVTPSPARLMLSDKLYRLQLAAGEQTRFFAYALSLRDTRAQLAAAATGASSSMQNISQSIVRRLALPYAAPERQGQLVALIEAATADLADLGLAAEEMQLSLTAYRESLITEAVTGKLDVSKLSGQQLDESLHAAAEGERPEVLSS